MSSENDGPSADDGGRNGSQTPAVEDVLAVRDDSVATTNTDQYDSDVHSCGRCKLQFSNIDDFIKHKLQHGDCRLKYSKSGHLKLPKLVKKDSAPLPAAAAAAAGAESALLLTDANGEQTTAGKRRRGRPRKIRIVSELDGCNPCTSNSTDRTLPFGEHAAAAAAAASAAADEALPEHKCSTCGTSFHRKAALKCHLLQEHDVGADVGSDQDDDGGAEANDEGLDGYDSADNEWSESVVLEVGGGSRPAACSGGSTSAARLGGDGSYGRKRRAPSTASAGDGGSGVPMAAQAYSCGNCSKAFSSVDVLRAHATTHDKDSGYPCTEKGCHFAFKTKGSLKRHLRRHTDERPYKCNICNRAFRESGALTRHQKSRTPCAYKTDSDLPRYGKSLSLAPSSSVVSCLAGSFADLLGDGSGQLPPSGGGSTALARGTDGAASSSAGTGSMRSTAASVLGSTAQSGTDDSAMLSNIQRCCQVCKVIFVEAEQLMEHLRSHLVQQQHQQPVQCGLCGHTAPSGDALDEHVAQLHATELDAKVIDEALDQTSVTDVVLESGDNDATAVLMYSTTGSDANISEQPGDAGDIDGASGSCLQAIGDGETSASSLNGSYPPMSENGTSSIVVVKLNDGNEENSCGSGGSNGSRDGLEATEDIDDESVNHSAVGDQDALLVKCVRDSTVAVQQLLQLSTLLAASQAAAQLGSRAPGDIVGGGCGNRELSASQATRMAVSLAQRTCPVCRRTFKAGSYLRLHMRSHTGERPHKCPHCPKDFATKDTFNKHLLAHSDERLYKCGECGKMFKRISHVKEHLKIHSSERPYPCSDCDKTFKTTNAWKVHSRTHSKVMAWKCSSCPRQFREKSSLVRHARTHTGERPYPCRFCGRHFSEHGTLNRHLRAKVPCTYQLSQLRLVQQSMSDDSVANFTVTSAAVGTAPGDVFATVLTEFSSVAAHTQYINPDGSSDTSAKAIEQCIVLEQGASLEDLQTAVPKADSGVGQHEADIVGLPTFYVIRTSDSSMRIQYSCDDELLQQDGNLYASEAVVMLQNHGSHEQNSTGASGSESAAIMDGGSSSITQMSHSPGTASADTMPISRGIADSAVLVPIVDDDEESALVVSSTSG